MCILLYFCFPVCSVTSNLLGLSCKIINSLITKTMKEMFFLRFSKYAHMIMMLSIVKSS